MTDFTTDDYDRCLVHYLPTSSHFREPCILCALPKCLSNTRVTVEALSVMNMNKKQISEKRHFSPPKKKQKQNKNEYVTQSFKIMSNNFNTSLLCAGLNLFCFICINLISLFVVCFVLFSRWRALNLDFERNQTSRSLTSLVKGFRTSQSLDPGLSQGERALQHCSASHVPWAASHSQAQVVAPVVSAHNIGNVFGSGQVAYCQTDCFPLSSRQCFPCSLDMLYVLLIECLDQHWAAVATLLTMLSEHLPT